MIIGRTTGLKLIREYGLPDWPDIKCEYHTVGGGIIAVRDCEFGGKEIHIAFKKEFRPGARAFIIQFCNDLDCEVWAKIESKYRTTVNMAFKCGFEYDSIGTGERLDGTKTIVHIMKRAKQ